MRPHPDSAVCSLRRQPPQNDIDNSRVSWREHQPIDAGEWPVARPDPPVVPLAGRAMKPNLTSHIVVRWSSRTALNVCDVLVGVSS